VDRDRKLQVLVPIREYIRRYRPPPLAVLQPLRRYFRRLMLLWRDHRQISPGNLIPRMAANLGNFQALILDELDRNAPDVKDTVRNMITFAAVAHTMSRVFRGFLLRVLDLVEETGDITLQGEYITALFMSWMYNEIPAPEELSAKTFKRFREAKDTAGEGDSFHSCLWLVCCWSTKGRNATLLQVMADVLWHVGDYSRGKTHARKGREMATSVPNFMLEAHCFRAEAVCCMALGQFIQAAELITRARERLALCGLQNGEQDRVCKSILGNIHFLKTEYAESRSLQVEIVQDTSADQTTTYPYGLMNIAFIDVATGVPEPNVTQNVDTARAIFHSTPLPHGLTGCAAVLAMLDLREGRTAVAKSVFEALYLSSRGNQEVSLLCLERLADHAYQMNDLQTTARWATLFLGSTLKARNRLGIAQAIRCLSGIFSSNWDRTTALNLLDVALAEFSAMGIRRHEAECSLLRAKILENQGAARRIEH
ncbi:hypothetical protein B0H16DRAFT_1828785, partial [Mycena metata]